MLEPPCGEDDAPNVNMWPVFGDDENTGEPTIKLRSDIWLGIHVACDRLDVENPTVVPDSSDADK